MFVANRKSGSAADFSGIGVNQTLQLAYISNNTENSVTVLDYASPNSPEKPALTTIANVGSGPDRFALNTGTNDMYVSDNTASQVTSIASDGSIQGTVTVGAASPPSAPTEMGYLPSTGLLYVALQNDNEVAAVDPSSFSS